MRESRLGQTARRVWRELLLDHRDGHVVAIAKRLKVSPGRVGQAKREIGDALEARGYGLDTRSSGRRGRPRKDQNRTEVREASHAAA